MTEQFILQYAPERVKQLGYATYHLKYHDLVLHGNSSKMLQAYNELHFIVEDPKGLVVESDYGLYDSTDDPLDTNIHQHRGEIIITNPSTEKRRIKLIQIIIVN
jgi:hypothetical protein